MPDAGARAREENQRAKGLLLLQRVKVEDDRRTVEERAATVSAREQQAAALQSESTAAMALATLAAEGGALKAQA